MKRYLAVKFNSNSNGQRYTYEFPVNYKLTEGQYVTVATPHEGIKAVKICAIYPKDHVPSKSMKYKMIHGVVKAVQSKELDDGTEKANKVELEAASQYAREFDTKESERVSFDIETDGFLEWLRNR